MALTASVMDPAWINYSPVVHKKQGDAPTSCLLLYSYIMTHLHICEAVTLARTRLVLKLLIPSQNPALTSFVVPLYRQVVAHYLRGILVIKLKHLHILVGVRGNSFSTYSFLEVVIGVSSVLCVILQLVRVRTRPVMSFKVFTNLGHAKSVV